MNEEVRRKLCHHSRNSRVHQFYYFNVLHSSQLIASRIVLQCDLYMDRQLTSNSVGCNKYKIEWLWHSLSAQNCQIGILIIAYFIDWVYIDYTSQNDLNVVRNSLQHYYIWCVNNFTMHVYELLWIFENIGYYIISHWKVVWKAARRGI